MSRAETHDASFGWSRATRRESPLAVVAAFPLAALVAFVSLVGILHPSIYARETPNWAGQAIGQDWVDLLFAAPWLAFAGWWAMRGSRRAMFLLAGGMLYTFYEFAIYAFAVHFNALFLAYSATLGLTFYALAGMALLLERKDVTGWFGDRAPARTAGTFLVVVGALFTLLWLGDVIPALLSGTVPISVAEAGAPTNPVYVMDLSIVLPLHVIAGVAILRRRRLGFTLAPIVLAFGVLMALSIGGMMIVMHVRGLEVSLAVAAVMFVVAAASAAVLAMLLRRIPPGLRRAGD